MFTNLFKKTETNLDKVIAKVTLELAEADPESKDYAILSETLVRLSNVKAQLEPDRRPRTEVLIQMGGILISLVSILNYEKTNVVTTKAMPKKAVASVPRNEARMPVATVSALVKTTCARAGSACANTRVQRVRPRRATCSLRMSWICPSGQRSARMRS